MGGMDIDVQPEIKTYLVELVSAKNPLFCQAVKQRVQALDAADALRQIVGDNPIVASRWVDTRREDHYIAEVMVEGDTVLIRSSRAVEEEEET